YALVMLLGVSFFVALPLAIALGVALGAALELVLLRRLRGADIDTTMLVMIGAWIALQNAEQLAWTGVAKSISTPFPAAPLVIGPVSVAWNRVFVLVVALILIGATYLLINQTKLGRAMRATFQDRDTAALMGVRIGNIHTATFALGSGLAAAGGALLGPVFVAYPSMGDLAAAKAFAIVILGGLGSIPGATLGGFILALVEELGAGYVSSGYRDAMGFLLIIAGIFIIAAMSLNLLLGYAGQLSLGHVAFFGIGAYASALVSLGFKVTLFSGFVISSEPKPVWLGMFAGIVAAGLSGWFIGRVAFKVRGAYFVIVSISFAEVARLVALNWVELTQGPMALNNIPPLEAWGFTFLRKPANYWLERRNVVQRHR